MINDQGAIDMFKLATAAVLLVFSGSALAANALGVSVTRMNVLKVPAPKGSVLVHTSNLSGYQCGGNPGFAIDMNDPSSDLLYAQLMMVFNAETKVDILGSGKCAPFAATSELINEVRMFK